MTYETNSAPSSATTAGERWSIDTPEFRKLLDEYDDEASYGSHAKARKTLIAHIDTWAARSAGEAVPAQCDAAFDQWYAAQRHQLTNEQVCRLIWQRGWQGASANATSVAWMKPDEITGLLAAAREDVPTRHYGRVYAKQYDADMVPVCAAPAPGNTAQPTAYDTMDHDQLSKLGQQQKGEHDGR